MNACWSAFVAIGSQPGIPTLLGLLVVILVMWSLVQWAGPAAPSPGLDEYEFEAAARQRWPDHRRREDVAAAEGEKLLRRIAATNIGVDTRKLVTKHAM